MFHTFYLWLTRSSEKSEKIAFKNHREAAEFVRRLYNENGQPNAKLREVYQRGRSMRQRVLDSNAANWLLLEIYPFDKARVRNTFECGRRPIDVWYKNKAKKCAERLEFAVFEAVRTDDKNVVGYNALQIGSESLSALDNKPDDYTKNYTAFPAVHLAFLGVHSKCQRQGIGTTLLSDVFDRVVKVAEHAGFYALTLQSLDINSTRFYEGLGLQPYAGQKENPKMLIPIRTIRNLVTAT
jgi:ribosomal protein S18 acetylase RimI-like enzyme